MAGKVLNIKVCSPLKLLSDLTRIYHAICHYSYNLPLCVSVKKTADTQMAHLVFADTRAKTQKTKRAIFLPTHRQKLINLTTNKLTI
jgi:hypothetical protein